ncbi:hypothetical protein BUE80_DR007179 [Diplocarpon rosae]|nr:hypothetical protein BUE80_DR007179 [Diplocarpon rosae]
MGLFRGVELTLSYVAHSLFRFVQLVLALTVCGLYAGDLNRARRAGKDSDGRWVYAEVTASLAAVTALIYLVPCAVRLPMAFVGDAILCVLWIALFGLFGNMYIRERAEGDAGVQRMKNAVWVDLANAMLWLLSAVGMAIFWRRNQAQRTNWTGRARV